MTGSRKIAWTPLLVGVVWLAIGAMYLSFYSPAGVTHFEDGKFWHEYDRTPLWIGLGVVAFGLVWVGVGVKRWFRRGA